MYMNISYADMLESYIIPAIESEKIFFSDKGKMSGVLTTVKRILTLMNNIANTYKNNNFDIDKNTAYNNMIEYMDASIKNLNLKSSPLNVNKMEKLLNDPETQKTTEDFLNNLNSWMSNKSNEDKINNAKTIAKEIRKRSSNGNEFYKIVDRFGRLCGKISNLIHQFNDKK